MTSSANVPLELSFIITSIINIITCPFTVLLNVLVIHAVKTRLRLPTNSNIFLACLAVIDVLTGVLSQPSYVLWRIIQLLGLSSRKTVENVHLNVMVILMTASCLHLMLVTSERLIAIKFTMQYSNVITENMFKIAVLVVGIIALTILRMIKLDQALHPLASLIAISFIVFVAFAYVILYHETLRHQRKIRAQQLPKEEVEKIFKENKALKTTVLVADAILVYLLPVGFCIFLIFAGHKDKCRSWKPWRHTFATINSLVNPLIYCSRQREMRKFIFRKRKQVVAL